MNQVLIEQLIQESISNVNVSLVVALMAVGFIIKHFKILEKLENNLIPPILLCLSIAFMIVTEGFTVQAIISAIVNAAVSIGLHQQGKNIFTISIVPAIVDALQKLFPKNDEEPDAEDVEEGNMPEAIEPEPDYDLEEDNCNDGEPIDEVIEDEEEKTVELPL